MLYHKSAVHFPIEKQTWSTELIQAFQIRAELLPELHSSSDIAGTVTKQAAKETGLIEGMPVVIGGGDGSCACVYPVKGSHLIIIERMIRCHTNPR